MPERRGPGCSARARRSAGALIVENVAAYVGPLLEVAVEKLRDRRCRKLALRAFGVPRQIRREENLWHPVTSRSDWSLRILEHRFDAQGLPGDGSTHQKETPNHGGWGFPE